MWQFPDIFIVSQHIVGSLVVIYVGTEIRTVDFRLN